MNNETEFWYVSGYNGAMVHSANDWEHANQVLKEHIETYPKGNFEILKGVFSR
tara:strand:- start:6320 stop:6478 length:159 start_codon:yes stop_codon:yes gene_type:complete